MKCANCPTKECNLGKDCLGNSPKYKALYTGKYSAMIKSSAEVIREAHSKLNRLDEIILFSKKMNYTKLGVVFCIATKREAEILANKLKNDFEVYSVCCKVNGIDKKDIGTVNTIDDKKEVSCNPCCQADVLNGLHTDLNIILGLCVGHDILFQAGSKAPCTTLLVKDRVNENCTSKIFLPSH
ncbi:Uncharacterised protein [uncultured archaeon]|nr:Uncharacterised protein [uncultured archaeon]